MIETRLALPQRSPSPLSVPWIWRAPARTAASEFATACSVSLWAWMPTWSPGMCLDHLARRSPRPRAAACRHWCRTARPSARPPRRRPWRRRARMSDWPCSRRRNARSRAAPRGPSPWPRARCRGSRRGSPRAWSRARRARDSPRTWRRSRSRRPWRRAAPRGPGSFEVERPGRRVMPNAVKVACELALLGEQLGVGRVGAGIAALDIVDAELVEHAARSRACRASVKSTPLVCAPSRSVVSKR